MISLTFVLQILQGEPIGRVFAILGWLYILIHSGWLQYLHHYNLQAYLLVLQLFITLFSAVLIFCQLEFLKFPPFPLDLEAISVS